MRLLLLASSLSLTLVAVAAADPDAAPETTPGAAPLTATAPAAEEPKTLLSPEAKPKPDAKAKVEEIRKLGDNYLKQCMQDWDAATHMTKKEWERTCRRVAQGRTKFLLDQVDK